MLGKNESTEPSAPPLLERLSPAPGAAATTQAFSVCAHRLLIDVVSFFTDNDMRVPLVSSPNSSSPADYTVDTAIASAAVESESKFK